MDNYNKFPLANIISLLESRANISNVAIESLLTITCKSEDEINNMSIQCGLSTLTHWLTIKLNNPKVSANISALELLRIEGEESPTHSEEETTYTIIGNLRFRDNIKMIDWRNAESIAISSNKPKLFSLYLVAHCCVDGYNAGKNMFVDTDINEHIMSGLSEFNRKQQKNKNLCLDLLSSFEFLTIGTKKRLTISDSFFLPKFH